MILNLLGNLLGILYDSMKVLSVIFKVSLAIGETPG